MTAAWDADPTGIVLAALPKFFLQPRFKTVVYFRLSQWAWERRATRILAYWLQSRMIACSGAEIHPAALIGPGLAIVHSVGIVVGHDVVAGSDLVLHQGVTVGHRGSSHQGQPRIGDRVRIGAGAKVLGRLTVGDEVLIGANAVVLADVPTGFRVTGVWKGPPGDRPAAGRSA
jgi:serine O-acetyltransferase